MPLFFFYAPFALLGDGSGDFYVFYSAGKSWLSRLNPYTFNGALVPSRPTPFIYPPTSLPFFALFTSFDFRFASQLWWATYFVLFAVALLALTLTLKGDRRYAYVSIALLLFLTSYPLLVNFQLGQSDLLVGSLAILSLVCQRLKRGFASAALLSAATLLKGPPILLLIYFVIYRRDLRYLAYFVVSSLVIVGASLLIIPVGLYWYYIVNVLPTLSTALGGAGNQSFTGLISAAKLSQLTPAVAVGGYLLFALFSFWAGSRSAIDKVATRADAMFLLNVLVMLLFGPRSTIYPYVWVILPLALFLSALLMEQVRAGYLMLVCFAAIMLNSLTYLNMCSSSFCPATIIPFEVAGNLILTISLIPIYMRPRSIFRSPPSAPTTRANQTNRVSFSW